MAALSLFNADLGRADTANSRRQAEDILNQYYSLPQVVGGYSKLVDPRSGNTWFIVGEDHTATPQSTAAMYDRLEALRLANENFFILEEGKVFKPKQDKEIKTQRLGLESYDLYLVCLFQKIYFEQQRSMTDVGSTERFFSDEYYQGKYKKVVQLLKSNGWINSDDHLVFNPESMTRIRRVIVSNTTARKSPLRAAIKKRISLFFAQSKSADFRLRYQERDQSFQRPVAQLHKQKTNSVFVVHLGEFHRRPLTSFLKEQGLEIEHFDADYFALNMLGFRIDFMLSLDSVSLTDKLNYDFLTRYLKKQEAWNDMHVPGS